MNSDNGMYRRLRSLIRQIIEKEADCRIEKSENGEIVINTGIVQNGKRYRVAEPEELVDHISEDELKKLEEIGFQSGQG